MSYIGKNIKKIRSLKKLSQLAFAQLFDIGRASIGAYEEGRAEPKIDTVIQIAKHFNLTLDQLITKELTVNELTRFDIFKKGMNSNSGVSPTLQPVTGVRFVSAESFPAFLNHIDDDKYFDNLPRVTLPGSNKPNTCVFEVNNCDNEYNGDGLHPGDMLVAQKISPFTSEKVYEQKLYVLVLRDRIIIRRLHEKNKNLHFKADHPGVHAMEISTDQIKGCWEVTGKYSTQLKKPQYLEERMLKLEETVRLLSEKIN